MSKEKKTILYDSPEAASFMSGLSGWVDINNRYWGNDEHMARWSSATHKNCDNCGELMETSSYCKPCSEKKTQAKFEAMEKVVWDKETPLCIHDSEVYFWDVDGLYDYLGDNECELASLQLVIAEPYPIHELEPEYFTEDLHEDAELPDHIEKMIENLNKAIKDLGPQAWIPSKYAAIVEL